MGLVQYQANGHLEPPEAGTGKVGFSPKPWVGTGPADPVADTLSLDFQPPQVWGNNIFVVLSHPVVVICYDSPRKLTH